mmetsp:Transcript_13356/g.31526  ORF Transcript_13356/g.31526 Transcript_13356/m.31526 type:complete len:272 (-) Transcript_13356:1774-2589(-)
MLSRFARLMNEGARRDVDHLRGWAPRMANLQATGLIAALDALARETTELNATYQGEHPPPSLATDAPVRQVVRADPVARLPLGNGQPPRESRSPGFNPTEISGDTQRALRWASLRGLDLTRTTTDQPSASGLLQPPKRRAPEARHRRQMGRSPSVASPSQSCSREGERVQLHIPQSKESADLHARFLSTATKPKQTEEATPDDVVRFRSDKVDGACPCPRRASAWSVDQRIGMLQGWFRDQGRTTEWHPIFRTGNPCRSLPVTKYHRGRKR